MYTLKKSNNIINALNYQLTTHIHFINIEGKIKPKYKRNIVGLEFYNPNLLKNI